jgi:hypothetical protein
MTVARPIFSDGAILSADDLSTLESACLDRDARHARHLHTPGVGSGLKLAEQPQSLPTGDPYVELTLRAGYAVDGTGRELVVGADLPLSPDRFREQNLNPPTQPGRTVTVWHPVFIRGLDTASDSTTAMLGCQGRAGGGRIAEEVEIEFGSPGDASVSQPVPPPDAGPGDGTWRVLVGFVQFDTAIGQFVRSDSSADGVTVSGAGARAALVAGQFGRVELRAQAASDSGVPAVVLDSTPGPSLVFGTHTGSGSLSPLLKIDASGNLELQGAVKAKGTAGKVEVVGGAAFDGTVLPLPAGVDQATVDSSGIELFISVSPRLPAPGSGPTNTVFFAPAECRVDAERRVVCWGNWIGPALGDLTVTPISCDYLVLATVPGAV